MGDVAGVEPLLLVEMFGAAVLVVGGGNGGSPHFQAPEGLAVPGQFDAVVVGDLHLDAEGRVALLCLEPQLLLPLEMLVFGLDAAERAERAHFRHAPGMNDLDAVFVLERLRDRRRAGRAADDHAVEVRQPPPSFSMCCSSMSQTVGTAAVTVTFSRVSIS